MNHSKRIVITGASSGIGRITAVQLAKEGHQIVLAARHEQELQEVAEQCRQCGGKAFVVPTDVSKEEDMRNLADKAIHGLGHFDVWINNAAVGVYGRFEEIPIHVVRHLIDINVMGCIYGSREAIHHFKSRGSGNLINISSIVGVIGNPFASYYAMSKFAVRGLCLSLQSELADQKNIHVCCVMPGAMDTPFFQHSANYSGKTPKPILPFFDPAKAAHVISQLIKKPKPQAYVGMSAAMFGAMQYFTPHAYEKFYRRYISQSNFEETPASQTEGSVFVPTLPEEIRGGWKNKHAPARDKMTASK
jgi:short-subunit dehydrogenase